MSVFLRRLSAAAFALSVFVSTPAIACHSNTSTSVSNPSAGETSTHSVGVSPRFLCNEAFNPGHDVLITFPADYNIAGVTFDTAASRVTQAAGAPMAFPANGGIAVNAVARTVRLLAVQYNATWETNYSIVLRNVVNPTTAGTYNLSYQFLGSPGPTYTLNSTVQIVPSIGIDLSASPPKPALYAQEIIATASAPVTLTNSASALNMRAPLSYNFSVGEVRHARFECTSGMRFAANTTASYTGGGSASVGSVNGLGTGAVTFSVTANDANVRSEGNLMLAGDRSITSTSAVTCTYGLYDFPSQAAAGGTEGRVATVSGPYIAFADSTTFTAVGRESVAEVESNPAYSAFVVNAPTTSTTAALARLTYALAIPTPRKANGTAITLADLHATGPTGTRIVVDGDFTAAANADGTYAGAGVRVYLSGSNSTCTTASSIPAAALSDTQASFNVGATAADRMLCLAPLAGRAIPASVYRATLAATSAAPTVYVVKSIGPLNAGSIIRNGTELQAPLVQAPAGWITRIALTNTGSVARSYTIRVVREDGSDFAISSAGGTIPGNGLRVIDLSSLISVTTGAPRGTVIITAAAPNNQIQGLYQLVEPSKGAITNHVMVRPGSN